MEVFISLFLIHLDGKTSLDEKETFAEVLSQWCFCLCIIIIEGI